MSAYCYRCGDFHNTTECHRRFWFEDVPELTDEDLERERKEASERAKEVKAWIDNANKPSRFETPLIFRKEK